MSPKVVQIFQKSQRCEELRLLEFSATSALKAQVVFFSPMKKKRLWFQVMRSSRVVFKMKTKHDVIKPTKAPILIITIKCIADAAYSISNQNMKKKVPTVLSVYKTEC